MIIFAIGILIGVIIAIINKLYIRALIAFIFDLVIFLYFYFMYKRYYPPKGNIKRIDFIFSKDFNTLFIGLVKIGLTKYVATFEFQKNNITKFFYERADDDFNLKVQFKNNKKQKICTLKRQTQ